jgi:Squalene-hopene cyclase C-terminal domain
MNKWLNELKYNPINALLQSDYGPIILSVERDLLDKNVAVEDLWLLPEPQRILRKQKPNGAWAYPGGKKEIRSQENYDQIETYRNLGVLVEEFGFDKKHEAIRKAAQFLLSFQTKEGDLRGIYGDQYSPNYTAGITELLVKAGYIGDARIERVFEWLLSIRQNDGGWAIPLRTRNCKLDVITAGFETVEPDRSKPFSHVVSGVVLRAFAAHPAHRRLNEARQAGQLLLANLFEKDNYPDRAAPSFWLGFSFPFWFTDLISALDSLSLLGFSKIEPRMDRAGRWFVESQRKNGLWDLKILKGKNKDVLRLWLALAICRIFKRLYG